MLIYLNKHCFNGLYRVNSKGLFNVPCNGSTSASYCRENIRAASRALESADILCADFERTLAGARKGDLVFLDSPYAPLNPTSFDSYTKEGFGIEEHRRLAAVFEELAGRGCKLILTNHDTELVRELYDGFSIDVVQARRCINSDGSKRKGTEVIVRNFGR